MDLSWGLPRQVIRRKDIENSPYIELYKPVDGSTQLTTAKGEKKEAKIEGGENEAVKYGKNSYAQATSIRQATEKGDIRPKPIPDSDGVVEGEYEYWLQPENPAAPGLHIPLCKISVEDTWTSADGGQWAYTFDAIKEDDNDQIEWGKVTITVGADKKVTKVDFVEAAKPKTGASGNS